MSVQVLPYLTVLLSDTYSFMSHARRHMASFLRLEHPTDITYSRSGVP